MSKHSADILKGATLLLAGHGSSRPGGDNPVHGHCETLRATGAFAAVIEGYLKQAPLLGDVLGGIATGDLFVVPMLTGHGYITDELIPGALAQFGGGAHIHLCEPIGCHAGIPGLLANLVRSVVDKNGLIPGNVSALLAAHGNRENPQNARQAKALAKAIGDKCDGVAVTAAFIEELPLISDWPAQTDTENLIILPFMIGGGRHGAEDVPAMVGLDPQHPALATPGAGDPVAGPFRVQGRTIWYCRAVGHEPALAAMIIDLVKDALSSG